MEIVSDTIIQKDQITYLLLDVNVPPAKQGTCYNVYHLKGQSNQCTFLLFFPLLLCFYVNLSVVEATALAATETETPLLLQIRTQHLHCRLLHTPIQPGVCRPKLVHHFSVLNQKQRRTFCYILHGSEHSCEPPALKRFQDYLGVTAPKSADHAPVFPP